MPLNAHVPARPLAVYRLVLGAVALVRCGEAARILAGVYEPTAYRLPWVPWMPALDWSIVIVLLSLWAIASAAFTAGLYTRLSGTVSGLVMATVLLVDAQTYSNHLYLLATLVPLVAWAGGGAALSLDARRGRGSPSLPAWPVLLVRTQITAVYLFGALSKVTFDFITGGVMASLLPRPLLDAMPRPAAVWFVIGSGVAVIVAELLIVVGLWIRRLRPRAIGLAVLVHGGMLVLVGDVRLQIVLFAAMMLGSFVLWLDVGRERLVVWDDSCSACATWVRGFRALDWMGALRFSGSSDAGELARLGISREQADHAMHLVGPGQRASGFAAVVGILEVLPLTFLFAPFLRLPGVRHVGDVAYRRYAARRHCVLPVRGSVTQRAS